MQGSDGDFYGTTEVGGTSNKGTIFKLSFVSAQGTLQFATGTYTVNENAGSVSLTVQRVNGSAGAISVAYSETDGTAAIGVDYLGGNGTLTWADGDTSGKIITLPLVARGLNDNTTKTFSVVLSNATGGAVLGTPATATVTILDNDESFVTLHSFSAATDGSVPSAGLLQGSDGNFYGTTY